MSTVDLLGEWFFKLCDIIKVPHESTLGDIHKEIQNLVNELEQLRKEKAPNKEA